MRFRDLGVKARKLDHIFVSHLHGDHYFGLIGLVSTFHLMNRKQPLHIFGPPHLQKILQVQLETSKHKNYPLIFHPTHADHPEIIFENEEISVESIPMNHGEIPTTGFLFREKPQPRRIDAVACEAKEVPHYLMSDLKAGKNIVLPSGEEIDNAAVTLPPFMGRSYASCSDSLYIPALAEQLRGVDLVYHEATYMEVDRQKAHERYHATAREAALLAKESGAERLIIGHFSSRYQQLGGLLAEAREVFPNTDLALEGSHFRIERKVMLEA